MHDPLKEQNPPGNPSRPSAAQRVLATHNRSSVNLRDELLQAWRQEQWLAKVLDRTAIVVSLGTMVSLLLLLFAGGYDHFGLVAMSIYSVLTRLGSIVIHRVFLYPRLLAECASPDPRVREAARSLAERHRSEILGAIARQRLVEPETLLHLDWDEVAAWPQVRAIDGWRRFGRNCLGLWVVLSLALYALLQAILV